MTAPQPGPAPLLVNLSGSTRSVHRDSGRRSTLVGEVNAIALCGRFLNRFTVTEPTTDEPTCGQCLRRLRNPQPSGHPHWAEPGMTVRVVREVSASDTTVLYEATELVARHTATTIITVRGDRFRRTAAGDYELTPRYHQFHIYLAEDPTP